MGSEHNRLRRKWQDYGGGSAAAVETAFFVSFSKIFRDTEYQVRAKPKEFQNIYVNVVLPERELLEIYTPDAPIIRHGIVPDYAIDNTKTGKILYVELKRQDGWVEGGKRSDGRGNAHERSCKFFTPGLLRILRDSSKIPPPHLPFWTVLQGDITRDPCRVREISCWYEGFDAHLFFWRHSPNPELMFEHFREKLVPLLE